MNQMHTFCFRFAMTSIIAIASAAFAAGQTPSPSPQPPPRDPFAPQPAAPLPAGMTGADINDPRAKLKPGLSDAGEAAFGMRLLSLQKKPDVFQLGTTDPNDAKVNKTLTNALGISDPRMVPPAAKIVLSQLAFSNSDLAFQGTRLFQGNYYGVGIYDISDPANAKLLTTMVCPGGQGDVSVYKNLLFVSVEAVNGRVDCGTQAFAPAAGAEQGPAAEKDRFRGIRVFDISNIASPRQVAAVQTCRGSHTNTLVVDPNDKNNVYIYVSGTSYVRPNEELAGCSSQTPDKDPNTSLFRIDVIKVPLAAPEKAAIVSNPRIFKDPQTGAINGLNNGGSHGQPDKVTDTNQCHDITAYPALGLAAGACSGNGILLDIKDPANPKRIDAVNDPNYAYWHSASFSNDGKKVVFTDEWGGGLGARCRANDPNIWGADSVFRLENNKLKFASYYKMPAAQSDTENCVAHNGSLVPIPGRDVVVQAWYQGGVSVMDFTDPNKPREIAYFDRGAIDPKSLMLGGTWSAYWYNGNIYSSEIARGLDILELTPTEFLTQNEIDAAKTVRVAELNVQSQQKVEWPKSLTVAKAYLDQLERSRGLAADQIASVRDAIAKAETSRLGKADRGVLGKFAPRLAKNAATAKSSADANRLTALAEILKSPVL